MAIINVENSIRKKRRDLKDALGDDILRYIAELITNSDDSYRRIEAKEQSNIVDFEKVIYIELNEFKNKKDNQIEYVISITDNAEGMSKSTLEKIFRTYGNDNAGGIELHTRGIFGQGASDVLRSSAKENKIACIETIKDDKVSKLIYKMDEELNASIYTEELRLSRKKLLQKREELKIPKNGTRISFGIPSTVKFNEKIKFKLPTLIEKYPSFRYLLNQSNRKIMFIEPLTSMILSSTKYQFNKDNLISNTNFSFTFENKKINCNLKLYKNENKKDDNTNIIVIDENYNVFDNTMFDFQNFASAQNVSGELLINGLYNLCYEHLNSDNPDAIVRDNRTGFDTKNPFYIELNKKIAPKIESALKIFEKDIKITDLTNNKKFNEALKKLNKYLNAEIQDEIHGGNIKEINPPEEGIKFIRSSVYITKGKQYNMKLLINSNIIPCEDEIIISCDKEANIEIIPNYIKFSKDESEKGLVVKNIIIKAIETTDETIILKAEVGSRIAAVAINIIEDEIYYPENGFEFYKKELTFTQGKNHFLKLYIDSNIVPLQSEIEIECEGMNVMEPKIIFQQRHLINDNIGMIDVELNGGVIDERYVVEAKYKELITISKITIIEPSKNENLNGGLIAGFKLEPSEMFYQAYFNPYTHMIIINNDNPINKKIMGDMKDKNPDNPSFNKEQSKYLCDIIASQAANILVKNQNIKHGEINFDDAEEAIEKVQNLVQNHKNKIYQELYSTIVVSAK